MSRLHFCCAIAFLCLPLAAVAQWTTPVTASTQSAPKPVEVRMQIDVVVTDASGKPVAGLDTTDFTLLDNGQPAKILSFRAHDGSQNAGLAAQAILLVDNVNRDVRVIEAAEIEVEKFLRQDGGHPALPMSIFVLSDDGVKVQPKLSMDGNALADQLNKIGASIRPVGDSASGNGSIERFDISIRELTAIAQSAAKVPGKKLLIWLNQGWPLLEDPRIHTTYGQQQKAFASIVELSTLLRQARISLYSVSLGLPGSTTFRYQDYLKGVTSAAQAYPHSLHLGVLATQTGGQFMLPNNDMVGQLNRCFADASAFYTISFDAPHADHADEYHELKVQVDKPGLTARTDTGYYDQP